MEAAGQAADREQLRTLDDSLGFLVLIIASVLLSFWTVAMQRRGLCLSLSGRAEEAARLPDVCPARHTASAIRIGALGFFLCQAAGTWREALEGGDGRAVESAGAGLWAALLVLLAAILRFRDLKSQAAEDGRSPAEGGAP